MVERSLNKPIFLEAYTKNTSVDIQDNKHGWHLMSRKRNSKGRV